METLWVYDLETKEVIAEIEGADNKACETIASKRWGDTDYFGWTYSPAFGVSDGLIQRCGRERIEAQ
ncbi:MAG TPA: hypothetical protein VIZ18_09145 [Ktedonobacteraceae bacterium]